jgi:ribonucrease Y
MTTLQVLILVFGALAGAGASSVLFKGGGTGSKEKTKKEISKLLHKSEKEAEKIEHDAKGDLSRIKEEAQLENQRMEAHVERLQGSLDIKEKHVNDKLSQNGQIDKTINEVKEEIKSMKEEMKNSNASMIDILLETTGESKEKTIENLKAQLYHEVDGRRERFVNKRRIETEEDIVKIAQNILVAALQRYSDKSSVDRNGSLVEVKNEKFKSHLVGKNGENILHLESKFEEIEIIFNDYPKTITVGGGKLLLRQVVKHAIEILQKKRKPFGPKDIDIALEEAKKKVRNIMRAKAQESIKIVGLKDVPEGIMKHLGRLHFRTSYGQNALRHCIEVGLFSALLAAEIGADIEVARVAGFYHDIGKSLSEESDKGHDYITKDILEEFNYSEEIVHASWAHHEGEPARSLEAKIIMAADALSASRPGARLESLERYLERIRALESTAGSFPGIKKTFAISAGREVRILVHPGEIKDGDLTGLAHNIADKIEAELTYPGNVKVNVIRRQEWRAMAGKGKGPIS